MSASLISRCALAIVLTIAAVAVQAKEITLQHNRVMLNAELELAAGKKITDGVVLITHGALAHRDMESISYIRKLFRERGHNTLAINLSLGLNNRHGMYDCKIAHRHRNDDAVNEIAVWVDWLKEQEVKEIILLGHSRGGAQTALYAAERDNTLIKNIVLLAPATADNTNAVAYKKRYGQALAPVLDKAKMLAEQGKGDSVLEHVGLLTCRDTPATADSFISYYGQGQRLDTPYLLTKIKKPTLVVVAGNDEIVVGLEQRLATVADGKRIQMAVIDGADHLFRDLYADDAVDTIDDSLTGN